MFYRTGEGGLRLFGPGDKPHPARHGKTNPSRAELPTKYHYLLDWYQAEYCKGAPQPEEQDPILALRGLGKEIWAGVNADAYVDGLRSGWDEGEPHAAASKEPDADRIWKRILRFQGQQFRTVTKLPYTYRVEGGSGIWFYRGGRRIEHRLWRGELEEALRRPAVRKPSDLHMFQCPSYLFGLLTDPRITGSEQGA
jgi:hypothetical protein